MPGSREIALSLTILAVSAALAEELVVVPVLKDDFDLEHAMVPATLKLVRVR